MRSPGVRVLVTGAAGVLGRALCPALEHAGFDVVGLDRVWGVDLLDADLDRTLNRCVGVVHLAGCSRVAWAEATPERAYRDNVQATVALLDAVQRQVRAPWVIFTSSREVYGRPPSLPATEASPIRPLNRYGATKADAEHVVARAVHAGQTALTLRLANVYGAPSDHADRLIPSLFAAAWAGAPLDVRGPRRSLDLLHVDDAIWAITTAAQRLSDGAVLPSPLNLCSGVEITLSALASRVLALTGSNSPCRTSRAPRHEVARFVGDNRAARQALGWAPKIPLEEGLRRVMHLSSPVASAPSVEISP